MPVNGDAVSAQKRDNALMEAKVDPLLKNVQSDPRFKTLLKKLGLQD